MHARNLSTGEGWQEDWELKASSNLHGKLKANLGYVRPLLKELISCLINKINLVEPIHDLQRSWIHILDMEAVNVDREKRSTMSFHNNNTYVLL